MVTEHQPPADHSSAATGEVLVRVEGVGKKFCRDLKKSLWYGMQDIASELLPGQRDLERHATLRPGEFWALDEVSFELRRGECLGLIGRNGAGKSTLLKMLNGLIKPDKGRIEMRGRVGALIELGTGMNPILSGRENIYVNGAVLGFSKQEVNRKLGAIVEFAEIGDFIDMPVKNYSSGMKVRLGFAVASQLNPDILLLDEVLAVGDEIFRKKCFDFLYKIQNEGTSFIIVSHNPYAIERMCTYVVVLNKGKIAVIDESKKAIAHYHALLAQEQPNIKKIVDFSYKDRLGTGQIRIKSVDLVNKNGQSTKVLNVMESFSIIIDFIAFEKVHGPRFTVEILSSSDVQIMTFCTYGITESISFDGLHRLILKIPKLQLMTDVYSIDIKVGKNVRLDTLRYALSFKAIIENEMYIALTGGRGILVSDAEWVLE